jgi:hypothetical protein
MKHIKESNPYCCFAFKENRVKGCRSLRRSTPYFQGKGICRHPGCGVEIELCINAGADEDIKKVTVRYSANVHHDTSYLTSRHVSGERRKILYEKLQHVNPSTYHHEKLSEMQSDVYASGNRDSSTANVDVLRKIKSEIGNTSCEDRNVVLSILHQKTKFEEATEKNVQNKKLPGYIQRFCPSPLQLFLWTETGIRLFNDFACKTKVFLDATGFKVKKVLSRPSKKIIYYSLVLEHPSAGQAPIAVAELISAEHDVDSISFFISKFLRDVRYVCATNIPVLTLEIDNSMALILSILKAFNCEDMSAFLRRSHRILIGQASKGDTEKCNPHVCSAHVLNAIKKKSLKLYVQIVLTNRKHVCFILHSKNKIYIYIYIYKIIIFTKYSVLRIVIICFKTNNYLFFKTNNYLGFFKTNNYNPENTV